MIGVPIIPRWELLWLWATLFRASFRSVFRRSFSISGLYVILMASVLVVVFSLDHEKTPQYLRTLFFLFGPISLSMLILFAIRSGLSQSPFQFSAAETSFLMSVPLTRRDLLGYKIFQLNIMALLSSLLASLLVSRELKVFGLSLIKFYVILMFLQSLPIIAAIISGCRETLLSRLGRLIFDLFLGMMVTCLVAAIYFAFVGQNQVSRFFGKVLFETTRPLFFTAGLMSRQANPALKEALGIFIGIDVVLFLFIQLGHQRLQIDSVLYRNLNDSRKTLARLKGTPLRAWSLGQLFPLSWFNWGNGLGPILWRKIHEYWRNMGNIFLISFIVLLSFTGFAIFMLRVYPPIEEQGIKLWQVLCAAKIFVMISALFSGFCDLRSDTSQIAVYRTWPITEKTFMLAQILVSALHLVVLLVMMTVTGLVLYRVYSPYQVHVFGSLSLLTLPVVAILVASVNAMVILLYPVPESTLTGRTVGKVLMQFGALVCVILLLSVGDYQFESWAANLAKEHHSSHYWFFVPIFLTYSFLGAVAFALLIFLFRKFDVTRTIA